MSTESKICPTCGAQFFGPHWEMKDRIYCSRECYYGKTYPSGPEHHCWNGGIEKCSDGRIRIKRNGHARADRRGYVLRSILIAESALGRPIPRSCIVHHSDRNKSRDVGDNLVICEDQAYHLYLHARMRTQEAGGNPNTHKLCGSCKLVLPIKEYYPRSAAGDGLRNICKACCAQSHVKYYKYRRPINGESSVIYTE